MGSSDHLLFNRHTCLHEILGGGLVADLILWRGKNVTMGLLLATLSSWVVFERSGHTLLSLVSSVLLLLLVILFIWAKSAEILNRPAPPLPHLQLSEETVNEAAALIRDRINAVLSISEDIALGKDSKMFVKAAAYLLLISVIGSLTDFLTLCYTSKLLYRLVCIDDPHINLWSLLFMAGLFVILTIPALYERYQEDVDRSLLNGNTKLKQLYVRFDEECIGKVKKWILEKEKLS